MQRAVRQYSSPILYTLREVPINVAPAFQHAPNYLATVSFHRKHRNAAGSKALQPLRWTIVRITLLRRWRPSIGAQWLHILAVNGIITAKPARAQRRQTKAHHNGCCDTGFDIFWFTLLRLRSMH